MAEAKKPLAIKLPPEHRKRLEESIADIENMDGAISALKEIGMDMSQLEEKLTWAKKAREILLKRFT